MGFKDQIAADRNVFLNAEEFAEAHTFDGQTVAALVDSDLSTERGIRFDNAEGTNVDDLVVFLKTDALASVPVRGQRVNFDGTHYLVDRVSEAAGLVELTFRVYGT